MSAAPGLGDAGGRVRQRWRAMWPRSDHGSWGAPACVAVGSIMVPTDRLPVDEDIVAGIWSLAATARSAQGRRVRDAENRRQVWRACGGSRPRQVPDFACLWRCGAWFAIAGPCCIERLA